jgi:hypothetical protein
MPNESQILLPFAEREYIDVGRTAKILGVSHGTVTTLHAQGKIEIIEYAKRAWKRVLYRSVVDFCDSLRIRYAIADRRPKLSHHMFRHRDEDLLPFPLTDTISPKEAMHYVHYTSPTSLTKLIEEGHFDAYRLMLGSSWWRISRTSFASYLNGLSGSRAPKSNSEDSQYRQFPQDVHR